MRTVVIIWHLGVLDALICQVCPYAENLEEDNTIRCHGVFCINQDSRRAQVEAYTKFRQSLYDRGMRVTDRNYLVIDLVRSCSSSEESGFLQIPLGA